MNFSVASVTVTYNGIRTIAKHVESLLAQKRPLDEIIVVDNGSSDGSQAFLTERFPQITVLRLDVNVGMAGGWAAGMEYAAFKRKHDWIWSFDDDSVPPPELLEKMLSAAGTYLEDQSVGILAPIPVEPGTGVRHPPKVFNPRFNLHGYAAQAPEEVTRQPVWFADIVIASGCLVRRQTAEKIGVPRADFYMDFFDTEFSLRARAAGFKIAAVSGCEMVHTIGNTKVVQMLGKKRVWIEQPPWRVYYMGRNLIYSAFRIPALGMRKAGVLLTVARLLAYLILCGENKVACTTRLVQGISDGMRGRLGIRFTPRAYAR